MAAPETVNKIIYPFADCPFLAKRPKHNQTIEVVKPFKLPLPSQTLNLDVKFSLDHPYWDEVGIRSLSPTTGYRIGKADLRSLKSRRAKIKRTFNRDLLTKASEFSAQLDFQQPIDQGLIPFENNGTDLLTFRGDDAKYLDTLRCSVISKSDYEAQGYGIYSELDSPQPFLEILDGYKYMYFSQFYPFETGPLPANADYSAQIDPNDLIVGLGHPLTFRVTPRYFQSLKELGVIFYQSLSPRVRFE